VAVLGTALGPRHIQVLRRFVDRVILVLDGDEAGQRRTNEILELFVAAQIDLRILTLPEELDPCEFLLERGAEPFLQMLGGAVDALEHKTRTATRGIDLMRETHQANQALEEILATIAKAPAQSAGGVADSRLREQQFLSRLARQFGLPEQELRSRVNELRRKQQGTSAGMSARPAAAKPPALPKLRDLDAREIELLEILVVHPELAELALREIEVGQLKSECIRIIYRTIHGIHDTGGTPDFGNVLTALDDPGLKNIWVELDERAHAKAESALTQSRDRLQGLIDIFRYATMTRDRPHQLAALEEKRLDDQQELAVLQRLIAQERGRHGISAPKDG
jgi:DNA primase